MTTSLDYSTLRIGFGDSDITGSILCNAICSFFWKKNGKEKNEKNVIEISNRYFDAKVVLKELMMEDDESQVRVDDEKEDGILLAFVDESGCNPVPFDTLTMIHERAEDIGQCGDLLRLCVGITFTSVDTLLQEQKKEYEEEYSRRVLWCLDRGYEYIEADLSEQGQITGHDLREKDGFARIIEAMNGTVWSSSIRKTPKPTTLKTQPTPSIQTNKPQTTTTIEEKKALPSNPTNEQIKEQKEESNTTTTKSINDDTNNQKSEENKEDIFIDEFEEVMKEASRIRSASKSGQLSDEERRQRAGDAASALMGLLDRMGFDDDDDDDDDYIDSSDDDTHPNKKK